jgi:hypothetical protein
MSSIYAWIGGRRIPFLAHSAPTHLEALMMTSLAIVKAMGEIVQPAVMPTFRRFHEVVKSAVMKHSCRSLKQAFTRLVMDDGTWKMLKDSQRRLWGTDPKAYMVLHSAQGLMLILHTVLYPLLLSILEGQSPGGIQEVDSVGCHVG